jgi:hypothetical protein
LTYRERAGHLELTSLDMGHWERDLVAAHPDENYPARPGAPPGSPRRWQPGFRSTPAARQARSRHRLFDFWLIGARREQRVRAELGLDPVTLEARETDAAAQQVEVGLARMTEECARIVAAMREAAEGEDALG